MEEISELINTFNSGQKTVGSLCFYGHWFGKPFDNLHVLVFLKYDTNNNLLTFIFNNNEILEIWNPKGIKQKKFSPSLSIDTADKLLWRCYSNGRNEESTYFIEIVRKDNSLEGNENNKQKLLDLDINMPAVSIG